MDYARMLFHYSFDLQIPDSLYLWLALPLFLLTFTLNTWAVVVIIMKKEKNGMNEMIIWDCIVKIFVFAIILLVYASSFSVLGNNRVARILCTLRAFLSTFVFTFNRLVPVGIVLFRYIMVCHAVRAVNYGGEKPLWRTIQLAVLLLSLLPSVLIVLVLEDNLGFHKCIGQEEGFR